MYDMHARQGKASSSAWPQAAAYDDNLPCALSPLPQTDFNNESWREKLVGCMGIDDTLT